LRKEILIALALGYCLTCSLASPANGTTFHQDYGTYTGDTIIFQDVTEDSSTDVSALFGGPRISGNSLAFSPTSFGAYAKSGSSQFTSSTLSMLITGTGKYAVDRILLTEHGDYTLVGSRGTANTYAKVWAPLAITVYQVNGQSITPLIYQTNNMSFDPNGGLFKLPGDKGSGVAWGGSITFDVTQLLRDNGYDGYATLVGLTWENNLQATSESGTISYIKAKEAGGTGVTILPAEIIPEPMTFVGVLLGLTGLATYVRRRTASKADPR
jgi:hypothetical protein